MTAFVFAVDRVAAERPGATAILFNGQATSYQQLAEGSGRVAVAVIEGGHAPATRIGLLDLNSVEFLEAYIGICKAGCVPVGINSRLAAPELAYIVRDACLPLLLVGADHVALLESLEAELTGVTLLALAGGHPRWQAYASWRDAQAPATRLPGPADDLVQLYTSGTTGHPKGACHTLASWSRWGDMCRNAGWGHYDEHTVMLACMPLFHIAALATSLIALESGGRVVLMRRFEPLECIRLMETTGVTDVLMAPAVIAALLAVPQAATADFSRMRQLLYGAAPISEALLGAVRERFPCRLTQIYGMTENLGLSTYLSHADHDPALGRLRSCGRGYQEAELRIVDPAGKTLPAGETGEIVLRSPTVMRAYFGKEDATREALRDGWLHTGDAGYLDADGYLFIRDRVKDMIITGGENVYPAEVENALAAHPAVAEVAVIGVPDERWGEAVMAIAVVKTGATLELDSLRAAARERIAGYKLPVRLELVAALPRNASGKVLRRELRDRHWQGQDRRVN